MWKGDSQVYLTLRNDGTGGAAPTGTGTIGGGGSNQGINRKSINAGLAPSGTTTPRKSIGNSIKRTSEEGPFFLPDNIIDASFRKNSETKTSRLPHRLEQRGVLRSNCIDCLDRTNVAQVETIDLNTFSSLMVK